MVQVLTWEGRKDVKAAVTGRENGPSSGNFFSNLFTSISFFPFFGDNEIEVMERLYGSYL